MNRVYMYHCYFKKNKCLWTKTSYRVYKLHGWKKNYFFNISIFKLRYVIVFAYYNKIGEQFGESKRTSYELFTLGKGSSPREEPHAKFSLSVSPLTYTNQVAFPAHLVYSVPLKHSLPECVCVQGVIKGKLTCSALTFLMNCYLSVPPLWWNVPYHSHVLGLRKNGEPL